MTMSGAGRLIAAILIGGFAAAAVPRASAQVVLHSPRDIAACLCAGQNVTLLRDEVDRQRRDYETAKANYEGLSAQTEAQRGQVNINDENSISAYRQLLERRDAAEYHFKVEVSPPYAAIVARYNQAVQGYNADCASKMYDSVVLAEVQRTLYCPR